MMLKYDFSLKTREGQWLRSIVVGGLNRDDAERKLRQMYRNCEVTGCEIKGSVQHPGFAKQTNGDLFSLVAR